MNDKLLAIFKCSGAIAIAMFMTTKVWANSTEYVFSAPPEVDKNVVEEIPTQETDYPFYECESEHAAAETEATDEDGNSKIDSHDCDCIDCESASQENERTKFSSRSRQKKRFGI